MPWQNERIGQLNLPKRRRQRPSASLVDEFSRFASDFRRYVGVILALFRQEEESRRRAPLEYLLMLLEPASLIASIVLMRHLLMNSSPAALMSQLGGGIVLFFVTGFYLKYLFIYSALRKIHGSAGTPRKRFPVEQRLDGLIVHVLLQSLDWIIVGVLIFAIMYLVGIKEAIPHSFLPCVAAFVAVMALSFGWGIVNVVLTQFVWFWHFIAVGLNRALILFSGAFFVPDFLSPGVRYWVSFNPEMHAIALFRTAFYPHYPTVVLDTTYLTYCAIGAVLLGLVLERVTRRFERRS